MRILVVHADLSAQGGAEYYAESVIKLVLALGHELDIVDIDGIRKSDGELVPFSSFGSALTRLARPSSLAKYAVVCRELRSFADEYDIVIGTYAELPKLSVPTIRILHAPCIFSGDRELLGYLGVIGRSSAYVAVRRLNSLLCRALAAPDLHPEGQCYTITNSHWTSELVRRKLRVNTDAVIYPKVRAVQAVHKVYSSQNIKFICVGRIVPNKRIEEAVEVVSGLRALGFNASLSIVGKSTGSYGAKLAKRIVPLDFVRLCINASRDELDAELQSAQFGLHMYRNEHFGIAVAEMCASGCIPFVFNGGGVAELVPDDRLRFQSVADAVRKIGLLLTYDYSEISRLAKSLQDNAVLLEAMNFDEIFPQRLEQIIEKFGARSEEVEL